jgi:hypothetical protein
VCCDIYAAEVKASEAQMSPPAVLKAMQTMQEENAALREELVTTRKLLHASEEMRRQSDSRRSELLDHMTMLERRISRRQVMRVTVSCGGELDIPLYGDC